MISQTDYRVDETVSILSNWLKKRLTEQNFAWLNQKITKITNHASEKILFTSFSAVPRHLGKEKLNLSLKELQSVSSIAGWNPVDWTIDQAARSLLLLSFPAIDAAAYVATLDKIIAAADVEEAIAFYQSLPLLPYPEKFQLRAAEGIRTNMSSVFNAVALNNPYPAQYLDDLAWNQMILKALFIGSPLKAIYSLQSRNNRQLSQMLIDYARERLAANRTVSTELWHLAEPFQPEAVAQLKSKFS